MSTSFSTEGESLQLSLMLNFFSCQVQIASLTVAGALTLHVKSAVPRPAPALFQFRCRVVRPDCDHISRLTGDNIVDIWAASRGRPGLQDAQVGLSFSEGLMYDRNIAKRRMEELRKALQWETAPVITDFDPRYNNKRLLWFERLYQPFLGQNYRVEEEPIYDK